MQSERLGRPAPGNEPATPHGARPTNAERREPVRRDAPPRGPEPVRQPAPAQGRDPVRQDTPPREPATMRAKADLDLIDVSSEEHRSPDDPEVKERAVRRLERASPEGVGPDSEPRRVRPWMIALPALSFVLATIFLVWFLSGGTTAGFIILAAVGFIILSNAPLIGAIWLRQREKRSVERTVDEEAKRLSRNDFSGGQAAPRA